ncbi:O-acetyl-ADP-ribose deacetylase [Butyrivibrio sp. LC3010]|uniref:O-acetyl-ADP-ribose deacetylase n=1 Tax=Butyrivibrio sp. LC3010 TaxID=1280680 RepID=UPI00041AC288|nr:O-acetyl-ADP-ribose deacetylase [Butyrivibrio sp. LC3010]
MSSINYHSGDITKLKVDAIVNAANSSLLGGGGVDGAIHRAAGPGLLEECRTLNGCRTGEAKITGGYNLPVAHVIHTVGPIYSGKTSDAEDLHNCYWNSLDVAKTNNLHSIAFPGISTGVYGYPKKDAAKIALTTVKQWLEKNSDYDMAITIVTFSEEDYLIYQKLAADVSKE